MRIRVLLVTLFLISGCTHLAKEEVNKTAPIRVLFVGNSYTYYSHRIGQEKLELNRLPFLFSDLANHFGHPIEVQVIWHGGYTIAQHLSTPQLFEILKTKKWDYVIFQERTKELVHDLGRSTESAELLIKEVRKRGAKPLFFENWGKPNNTAENVKLAKNTESLKNKLNVDGIPIRKTWEIVQDKFQDIPLYTSDKNHASTIGIYVTAWAIYGYLFGISQNVRDASEDIAYLESMKKAQSQMGDDVHPRWYTAKILSELRELSSHAPATIKPLDSKM